MAGKIRTVRVAADDHGISAAELERRLIELGFVEGARVEILHQGLLGGDPIAGRINDATVALRRREAASILVEPDCASRYRPGLRWSAIRTAARRRCSMR